MDGDVRADMGSVADVCSGCGHSRHVHERAAACRWCWHHADRVQEQQVALDDCRLSHMDQNVMQVQEQDQEEWTVCVAAPKLQPRVLAPDIGPVVQLPCVIKPQQLCPTVVLAKQPATHHNPPNISAGGMD
jgi:hypothetical protein